ncbi:type VI secretion system membrane subunit TssM [Paraglaciecola arctica]|uniref:Type VI secretion system protein ImpL n=1 Tax=Paraglaciecola arctica BSs20135 TaxID=493475 RepID=K6ZE79_9ALTE|nr:type VI secretion system membrane subunit TssM [Paraglaciecola arctica]GAC21720.1 type VI secretion system protein ImpL [Paraglaciecola arctica BSs20135]
MEKIKTITSSRWFFPIVFFLLFSLFILFAGPYFAFAEFYPLAALSTRIFVILIVLFIYLIVQFVKYHRQMKKQQNLVKDITEEDGLNDVINSESAELKVKFDQAFSMLKNKKGGQNTLTDIPWYMIIGSPGSGKTTLLSNSGLQFPLFNELGNQAVQGVGGTKNCDWWITQEAVLLDTAGRYSSQDSHQKADQTGWNNFLGLIKKYRRKPISGLLVSFSMSDLMTMNEYEMSQHIMQMKQRIAEVNDFFKTRFPVYIIITKSDMLAGFSQFYETFSHKEREQAFGITFDKKDSIEGDILSHFSQEFRELTQSVTRRQWQRISLERDPNRKSLIYSFSDQFSSLKPTLDNILGNLAKLDDGLTTGIIRGVYFTSGTQSGAPIDRIIAKVSSAFGLKNKAKALWNNDQRSYFIKELLQQVIFPESDQFGVLVGHDKRKNLIKRITMAASAVFTLLIVIGFFISFGNNSRYVELSESSVDKWSKEYETSVSSGADLRSYIPALNDFADNIAAVVEQSESQFSGLGLAQSNSLENALTASYNRLLSSVLLPYIKKQVELQLSSTDDISEKYQALKAYLMLANADRRDRDFLRYWLHKNLNNHSFFTDTEFVQVFAHANNLIKNNMSLDSVDNSLVERSRRILQSQAVSDIYYEQFKIAYMNKSESMLSMAQLAGSDWRTLLTTTKDDIQTISNFFTPEIFAQVLGKEIKDYLNQLETETWILGEGNVINKGALSSKLEKSYARDYVNNWQELLQSVSVKQTSNMAALDSALKLAGGLNSPLFQLLESVSQATTLVEINSDSKLANLSATADRAMSKANRLNNLRSTDTPEYLITSQFSQLHELLSEEQKTIVLQKMTTIVSDISVSLNFDLRNENVSVNDNLLKPLQAFAYSQPAPLNRWGEQMARNIKAMRDQTQRLKIAKLWQQSVLDKCTDTIQFKYPFVRSSKTDAGLRDLSQLFGSSGSIYQFFSKHIRPLIRSNSYPYQWNENVARTYGFNNDVLPFFEQVNKIRDSLFVNDGDNPQLTLAFKPIYLDSRLSKFKMSIHGQNLSYQFGRPTSTNIVWPPQDFGSSSQFSFQRRDGSEVVESKNGLFALFRLIEEAKRKQINENKVEVTFTKNDFEAIYEITGNGRVNPLIISQLSNFKCLNEF